MVAELAFPDLLTVFVDNLGLVIESSLAMLTELSITSSNLCILLKTI